MSRKSNFMLLSLLLENLKERATKAIIKLELVYDSLGRAAVAGLALQKSTPRLTRGQANSNAARTDHKPGPDRPTGLRLPDRGQPEGSGLDGLLPHPGPTLVRQVAGAGGALRAADRPGAREGWPSEGPPVPGHDRVGFQSLRDIPGLGGGCVAVHQQHRQGLRTPARLVDRRAQGSRTGDPGRDWLHDAPVRSLRELGACLGGVQRGRRRRLRSRRRHRDEQPRLRAAAAPGRCTCPIEAAANGSCSKRLKSNSGCLLHWEPVRPSAYGWKCNRL